jgi:hypothetical protein
MSRRSTRFLVACVLVLLGATVAVLTGGQVHICLGPLGVTAVQCAKSWGIVDGVGHGLPFLALTTAVATFVVAPVPVGRRPRVLLGAIVGGAIGTAAFLALRPLTMEGFTSYGTWISVPRPLDVAALATVALVGALLGSIVVRLVPDVPRVTVPRS